jgi:Raf kinase inhibitor-like YbhB/YbcL family protein
MISKYFRYVIIVHQRSHMKKILIVSFLLFNNLAFAQGFNLKTSSFDAKKFLTDKHVYNGFGCSGNNVSPALEWSNAPEGTKSFAITVYDPDAPTGSGWWHWTLVNIPSTMMKIEESASGAKKLPAGSIEGRTDFGTSGYGGACPPEGDKPHRYIFTVYALKIDKLDINNDTPGAMVGFNLNANSLGKATFTVKYGR